MEAAQGHDCPNFPVPSALPALSGLNGGRASSHAVSPRSGVGGNGIGSQPFPTPTPAR
jgi:hypothetical protein